jgi:hypothetical protein
LLPEEYEDGRILFQFHNQCFHSPQEKAFREYVDKPPIISLDSWYEFLELPTGNEPTIFRGQGNWVARLAAAAFSVQMGLPIFILPDVVCWKCCEMVLANQSAGKKNYADRIDMARFCCGVFIRIVPKFWSPTIHLVTCYT